MSNYKIICNKTQLAVICKALESLARSHIGQFHIAAEDALMSNNSLSHEDRHSITEWLRVCGRVFMRPPSMKVSPTKSIAWDMMQEMRRLLAYANSPEGGIGLQFDEPFIESQEPRIELMPTDEKSDPRPIRLRFAHEIEEALGTTDLFEAVAKIRMWKSAYDSLVDKQ